MGPSEEELGQWVAMVQAVLPNVDQARARADLLQTLDPGVTINRAIEGTLALRRKSQSLSPPPNSTSSDSTPGGATAVPGTPPPAHPPRPLAPRSPSAAPGAFDPLMLYTPVPSPSPAPPSPRHASRRPTRSSPRLRGRGASPLVADGSPLLPAVHVGRRRMPSPSPLRRGAGAGEAVEVEDSPSPSPPPLRRTAAWSDSTTSGSRATWRIRPSTMAKYRWWLNWSRVVIGSL